LLVPLPCPVLAPKRGSASVRRDKFLHTLQAGVPLSFRHRDHILGSLPISAFVVVVDTIVFPFFLQRLERKGTYDEELVVGNNPPEGP